MSSSTDLRATDTLNPGQIDQLTDLFQREWWTKTRTRDGVRRMLSGSGLVVGLVEQDTDRLVGFARVLTDGVYKALIFDAIVAPDQRGTGAARMLMNHILTHPRIKHVRHKELYCLPTMVAFYRKWHFTADVGGVHLMRQGDVTGSDGGKGPP